MPPWWKPHAPVILPDKARRVEWLDPAVRATIRRLVQTGIGWPLVLFGPPGRGKTSAALLMLDNVTTGEYLTARQLVDVEFSATWEEKQELRRRWKRASLCVIDQFGMSGKAGPSQTQVMLDAIDARDGRPLVIVSNLCPERLAAVYDDQIRSRIEGGTQIEFAGPDHRVAAG